MANTVEYILSLNDKISGKLSKIGIANDKQLEVWAKAQQKINTADDTMNKCGRTIGSLQQKIEALKAERDWIPSENIKTIRAYNKEIYSLEQKMTGLTKKGRGVGAALKGIFSSIGFAGAFNSPLEFAVKSAGKIFKAGFEREQAQISMDVLIGNEAESRKLLKNIKNYGLTTPYDSAGLQENAKTMLGFGISADRIMPGLQAIGDIAMGDAEHMKSLTLAFSQVSSAGKLSGQDMLQMVNAGFNPLEEIARTTGREMSELRDAMSKGAISADMVRDAFISATSEGGRFYNLAQELGNSKSGKWANFLEQIQSLLLSIYDVISPFIIPTLNVLNVVVEALSGVFGGVAAAIGWWFEKLKGGDAFIGILTYSIGALIMIMNAAAIKAKALAIWQGVVTIATKLWTLAQAAFNAIMALNPLTGFIIVISILVGAIVWVCTKITGWGSLWTGIINGMKYIFMGFISIITARFNSMINVFMMGLDAIKLGWYKFKELIGWGDSTENQKAIAAINDSIEARKQSIIDGYKKAGDNFRKAGEAFGGIQMGWDSGEKKVAGSDTGAQLGISKPGIPGMNTVNTSQSTADGATGQPDVQTEAVTSGGSRSTTVNITLGSLVERIIYQGGYESNREAMERDIESTLIRVLSMARTAI